MAERVALRAVWRELITDAFGPDEFEGIASKAPDGGRAQTEAPIGTVAPHLTAADEPEMPSAIASPLLVPEREVGQAPQSEERERSASSSDQVAVPIPELTALRQRALARERQFPAKALAPLRPPSSPKIGERRLAPEAAGRTAVPDRAAGANRNDGGPSPVAQALGPFALAKALGPRLRVAAALAIVLVSVGLAPLVSNLLSKPDLAAERLALDSRAMELTARATRPGSSLACLDAIAGNTVEGFCENALFASQGTVTAALSYVFAQLSLLADAIDYARRGGTGYDTLISNLRHAAEADPFGLVAHVLSQRDSCTPSECRAFALLNDAGRVRSNLAEGIFAQHLGRHSESWPAPTKSPPEGTPMAAQPPAGAPPQNPVAQPSNAAGADKKFADNKTPRRDLFFPSAASIPPINIMVAEPDIAVPKQAPATPPTPPRRPAP